VPLSRSKARVIDPSLYIIWKIVAPAMKVFAWLMAPNKITMIESGERGHSKHLLYVHGDGTCYHILFRIKFLIFKITLINHIIYILKYLISLF
jgi:hypothetical protein